MKTVAPTALQKEFRDDFIALLHKYTDDRALSAMEMLALASYSVGQLVALQDQTKVTPDMALSCVSVNIELGNAHVIQGLSDTLGTA
jgi:hypothetical protein